jgi:hypothetical protein
MPDDEIIKRMNYFDRQFLRAADFRVEQSYHLDRHRRHNRLLHTPGLGGPNDLRVTGKIGQAHVTVSGGTAIDDEGREIVVPASQPPVPLSPIPEAGTYAMYVELIEKPTDPSTDPGIDGLTRMTEEPDFKFKRLTTDPPDPAEIPKLFLAAITVDAEKNLTKIPDVSMRKRAGTVAGFTGQFDNITANSLILTQEGQPTVQIESKGVIKSPMWKVSSLFENAKPAGDIAPNKDIFSTVQKFQTGGGTLLVFASGSGALAQATTTDLVIGMEVRLDDNNPPHLALGRKVTIRVKSQDPQPFVATFLVLTNIAPGTHNLMLKTLEKTTVGANDCFNVTILELPF